MVAVFLLTLVRNVTITLGFVNGLNDNEPKFFNTVFLQPMEFSGSIIIVGDLNTVLILILDQLKINAEPYTHMIQKNSILGV